MTGWLTPAEWQVVALSLKVSVAAVALTLHFADGMVDARVEKAGTPSYEKRKPEQPRLL